MASPVFLEILLFGAVLMYSSVRCSIVLIMIWLAPCASKMNRILRCNWLLERARWSYLARSGLPALSRKKIAFFCIIINPLSNKLIRSRRLDIGLFQFLRVYGPLPRLGPSLYPVILTSRQLSVTNVYYMASSTSGQDESNPAL